MDFDLQVKMFTDQLSDLIEKAKEEAGREFAGERANWEQKAREYEADIADLHQASVKSLERAEAAEQKYLTLQSKLSALV